MTPMTVCAREQRRLAARAGLSPAGGGAFAAPPVSRATSRPSCPSPWSSSCLPHPDRSTRSTRQRGAASPTNAELDDPCNRRAVANRGRSPEQLGHGLVADPIKRLSASGERRLFPSETSRSAKRRNPSPSRPSCGSNRSGSTPWRGWQQRLRCAAERLSLRPAFRCRMTQALSFL